jgi:RNA polymerase sigma-70 factor (ECF subfamily)
LIERVREDDCAAWDRLVSLYAPLVAHWCRRRRLPDDDMADVFQEVFQAVAGHIANFRNDRRQDTFRGWLRTITLNKVNDHFRKRQREPRAIGGSEALERFSRLPAPVATDEISIDPASSAAQSAETATPDELPAADDAGVERQLFQRGLELIRGEFEPRTWQAFWRTAVEGRSAKDVGADLAMSPGAVRVAKSRVLQRLREELGDFPE